MQECAHGIESPVGQNLCSLCREAEQRRILGKLEANPYRIQHKAMMSPDPIPAEPEEERRPFCQKCMGKGPSKGNQVYVRVPRIMQDADPKMREFAPTWDGAVQKRAKVRKSTHKVFRGKAVADDAEGVFLCDRCCRGKCDTCRNARSNPVSMTEAEYTKLSGSESLFIRVSPKAAVANEMALFGAPISKAEAASL